MVWETGWNAGVWRGHGAPNTDSLQIARTFGRAGCFARGTGHRLAATDAPPLVFDFGDHRWPAKVNQLDDYLRGVELELRAENVEGLNEVSAPTLGVPFDSIGGPTDVGDDPELSGTALCQSIESFPSSYQRFIRICLVDNDFRGEERKMVDKDPPIQLPSIPLTPATNSSSKTTEFVYGP
jgi:hypothetical protein